MFFVKASRVNMRDRHFFGVSFSTIAEVANSDKKRRQIRVGLIFWHLGFTFNF